MSDNNRTKERLNTVLFMLGITLVFISILSAIYLLTKDTIRLKESLMEKRAVLSAGGKEIPEKATDMEVEGEFNKYADPVMDNNGNVRYYDIKNNEGNVEGYVFERTGSGLWGSIGAMVGLSRDFRTITGVRFIKDNETPGLGARINEEWFQGQFRGRKGPLEFVPEKETAGPGEFQAVTGATITTSAVKNILNKALEDAPGIVEGGK